MATKKQAAEMLARRHYEVEPGLTHVYYYTDNVELSDKTTVEVIRANPIKLLEVNENTVPAGIMPLKFRAAPESDIPFPSVIVEVTPDEYEKIQTQELKLPEGWSVRELIPKPAAGAQ